MGFSLSDGRTVRLYAMIGSYIDSTSADDLTASGSFLALSNLSQLTDAIYTIPAIATFEGDGIDTSAGCYAPPVAVSSEYSPLQSGVWSANISDASGNLSTALDMTFGGHSHTSALTIYFGDCYAVNFVMAWYLGGSIVRTLTVTGNASKTFLPVEDDYPINETYDRIVLNISKVSEPYQHLKIAEIEFGASYTIGSDRLSGSVKIIYSHDPMGLSQSPNELDLTYNNIGGMFDDDNPNELYDNFALKNTINLAIEVSAGDTRRTWSMGRFYISDRYVTGNRFNVTALDCRGLMQNVNPVCTFSTGTSVGDALSTLLAYYNIGCIIDADAYSVYPDTAVSFDGKTDLLTITQYAVQYCGLDMWVSRDGNLMIGTRTTDTYGAIETDDMYSYPSIESIQTYNVVQVTYAGQVYEIDRSGEDPRHVIAVDNPFITTQAKAQAAALAIANGLLDVCKRCNWRGDLDVKQGDIVSMETRFNPAEDVDPMIVTEVIYEYNGLLKSTVTGVTLRQS